MPLRIITQLCPWEYRGEGCGYVGPPVAKVNDTFASSGSFPGSNSEFAFDWNELADFAASEDAKQLCPGPRVSVTGCEDGPGVPSRQGSACMRRLRRRGSDAPRDRWQP
ncbi:hypothetical protein D7Y21_08630 [Corallococcus sp. AB045]|uniref:hypothetical protein n=1 Tax=Corallococcus sp. AB045 TaxID=2316719 RepID=UPI000EBB7E39|nr:hypothetical protein D7Y21_08630 [Corallococcus sp. AB045]